jgi:hypothetical protein
MFPTIAIHVAGLYLTTAQEEDRRTIVVPLVLLATRVSIMSTKLAVTTLFLGASVALMGLSVPASAMTRGSFAAQEEHRVVNDLAQAQSALTKGRHAVALNSAANAETIMLNAQQFRGYRDPQTLAALKQTHNDFVRNKWGAATLSLKTAQTDLTMAG